MADALQQRLRRADKATTEENMMAGAAALFGEAADALNAKDARIAELEEVVNTTVVGDFIKADQRLRDVVAEVIPWFEEEEEQCRSPEEAKCVREYLAKIMGKAGFVRCKCDGSGEIIQAVSDLGRQIRICPCVASGHTGWVEVKA